MTVIINGTTGITNVNGSAAAPAETGTDTDTGIVYGTNTVTLSTGGTAGLIQDASQNVGVGGIAPSAWGSSKAVQVNGGTSLWNYATTNSYFGNNYYYNGSNRVYYASSAAGEYSIQGSAHLWYGAASGTAGATFGLTQVMSVDKGKTLALEGTTSVTGTGITFPATVSLSTNANTLDDYEEGTWTPSCPVSLSSNANTYVKIGRTVYLNVFINVASNASGSNMLITGQPFSLGSGQNASVACFNATGTALVAYMDSNGIYIRDYSNNTKVCSAFSGSFIAFQMQYQTDV